MNTAYLSLGANIGDRAAQLSAAIQQLKHFGTLAAGSSLYETEPVDVTDQPWFLNCVVLVKTRLSAPELMNQVLRIEADMGRVRTTPKGPRAIDIDILLFNDEVLDTPDLTIPHPAMHERRFVLEPIVEIAPEIRHPTLGKTMTQLLAALPPQPVVRKLPNTTIRNLDSA